MTWGPTNPGKISGQSKPTPLVVAPAFPATTVWQQNTNPYPVQVMCSIAAAATATHFYINDSASATGAIDLVSLIAAATLQNFYFVLPAGWYISATYTGGAITWTWIGGL